MIAVILSGGKGLRLRPHTDDKPKALVQVNGKPLAEHQLEFIQPHVEGVVFACGYMGERIEERFGREFRGLPLAYLVETAPLGTGGAVRKAISNLEGEDVMVLNGDVLAEFDLAAMIAWHTQTGSTMTMLAVPYRSPYGVVQIDKLRTVRKFEEKPEFKDVWVNGGYYLFKRKRILERLPEVGDLERDVFPGLPKYGEVQAFVSYGYWHSVDTIKDLQEAEEELKAGPVGGS